MLTKKKLLKTINDLPESFSLDDLFDRIILQQKIEVGITQSNSGETFSTTEAQNKLKKWLK